VSHFLGEDLHAWARCFWANAAMPDDPTRLEPQAAALLEGISDDAAATLRDQHYIFGDTEVPLARALCTSLPSVHAAACDAVWKARRTARACASARTGRGWTVAAALPRVPGLQAST
jgi:hypothetical protein